MVEPEVGDWKDRQKKGAQRDPRGGSKDITSWVLLGLALLYGVSPLDIVPDALPLVGWLDDLGLLLAAALNVYQKNAADQGALFVTIARYAKWVMVLFFVSVALLFGGVVALIILAVQALID